MILSEFKLSQRYTFDPYGLIYFALIFFHTQNFVLDSVVEGWLTKVKTNVSLRTIFKCLCFLG